MYLKLKNLNGINRSLDITEKILSEYEDIPIENFQNEGHSLKDP